MKNKTVNIKKIVRSLVLASALTFTLAACSTTKHAGYNAGDDAEIRDPFEKVNRATFAFNQGVDNVLLEPLAKGYRAITPKFARDGVRNFLRNLNSPINIANQILQGDVEGAASDVTRVLVNTTIGFAGFVDVAGAAGLEYEPEDFGQTLAVWGVGQGPYVVMPLLGPSSARDAFGGVADQVADPVRLYTFNTDREELHAARVAATVISTREELIEVLDDLEENSIDYYATMRSIYTQRRAALINDDNAQNMAGPSIPEYEEDYSEFEALFESEDYTDASWSLGTEKTTEIVTLEKPDLETKAPRKVALDSPPNYHFAE